MPSEGLPPITVRYNGLFDLDGLYAAATDWAKNFGYLWHEKIYKHKVPTKKGAEQELLWELTKNVTEYISHTITLTWHIWEMTEVTVETNGSQKKLTSARLYVKIGGHMTYDRQKMFKGKPFYAKLGRWYRNVVLKKEIEGGYFDTFYYRVWNLHALFKKYFDMQTKKYAYKSYLGEN